MIQSRHGTLGLYNLVSNVFIRENLLKNGKMGKLSAMSRRFMSQKADTSFLSHGFEPPVVKKVDGKPQYMDFQATTPMDPRVLQAMMPYFTVAYGNPHSRTVSLSVISFEMMMMSFISILLVGNRKKLLKMRVNK